MTVGRSDHCQIDRGREGDHCQTEGERETIVREKERERETTVRERERERPLSPLLLLLRSCKSPSVYGLLLDAY